MPFWGRRKSEPVASDAVRAAEIVAQHLPADLAAAYMGLARPAVHLRAANAARPVVARLGGSPRLPVDAAWPTWTGHGPLSFIASLDCAELATYDMAPVLPLDGQLLFFYWDGQLDQGLDTVGY